MNSSTVCLLWMIFATIITSRAHAEWSSRQVYYGVRTDKHWPPKNKFHGEEFCMDDNMLATAIGKIRELGAGPGMSYESDMVVINVEYVDTRTSTFVNVIPCYYLTSWGALQEFWVKKQENDFVVLYK